MIKLPDPLTSDYLIKTIRRLKLLQKIDFRWEGACPCFKVHLIVDKRNLHIWARCWEMSKTNDYQDLYVWGTLSEEKMAEIANVLKSKLDSQRWNKEYRLLGEPLRSDY